MLYSYGSFLSKITLSLLCIAAPVPYVSISPSKKREVQVFNQFLVNQEKWLDNSYMDTINNAKIKLAELFDKDKKAFNSKCNIKVKLLMQNRELENCIRSEDGKTYAFYHKATLRIHDVFVDENNRLMEIINISNTMKDETSGYEYKNVNVEPYVNQAGIIYLSMKQSSVDNSKIILQSGGDITITGSNLQISNQTVLSIIHNLELRSAWLATKSDLYTLYDYEKYLDVVHAVDDFMSDEDVKKSKIEKFIEKAKGIAGILGTFVGAILVEIMNKQ